MPIVKANPKYIYEELVPTILDFLNGENNKKESVFMFKHPIRKGHCLIALRKSLGKKFDDNIHKKFELIAFSNTKSKLGLTFRDYFDRDFDSTSHPSRLYANYFDECDWVFCGTHYSDVFTLRETENELRRLRLYFENLSDVNIKFITSRKD